MTTFWPPDGGVHGSDAPMDLTWLEDRTVARVCPLCGAGGPHRAVLHYRAPYRDHPPRNVLRCAGCRSMFLDDLSPPPHIEDSADVRHHTNFYVELAAGLEAMTELFYKLDTSTVRTYLEIGCGFGFALDFARQIFGWRVAGIDPGIIAQTGKRVFGLDVAADYVGPGYDFGGRFDLVMCSEVLEHVAAPVAFLATLERALSERGVLAVSTPNAEWIQDDTPMGVLLPMVQPGFHLVLLTRDALGRALREAGFAHVEVWAQGPTLYAVAGARAIAVNHTARADQEHYRRYLAAALERRSPSSLTIGMAYRLLKHLTNAGDLVAAEPVFERTRADIASVYGLDVGAPCGLALEALPPLRFAEVGARMPFCLGGVLYYRGIGRLIDGRHAEAADFFRAASVAAAVIRRALHTMAFDDGDNETAELLSRVHLPMALAHGDPGQALAALAELSATGAANRSMSWKPLPPVLLARAHEETFSRLVSLGRYQAAETLIGAIRARVVPDVSDVNDARARAAGPAHTLTALYCLAVLTRNSLGDPEGASLLFAAVQEICRARLADTPGDRQAVDLLQRALANETECLAATRLAPGAASAIRSFLRGRER